MKHLIIGPGSMALYMMMGALAKLKETGQLEDLEEISSSSAGAILASAFVFFKGDLKKVIDTGMIMELGSIKPQLKNIITKWGLIDSKELYNLIFRVLGPVTFRDLEGPKIHVAVSDLISGRVIYCSRDTTPDLEVAEAVRRSCIAPFIFSPVIVNGSVLVDGSVFEESPHVPFIGKESVFEIRYIVKVQDKNVPDSLFSYVTLVLWSGILKNRVAYKAFNRVELETDINIFDFKISRGMRQRLFLEGYGSL